MAKRILVIDDERVISRLAAGILTRQGYEAQTVASVGGALELLSTHPFDLITCDLMFPEISGLDFLAMMQNGKVKPDVPVMLITGLAQSESLDCAKPQGAVAVLTKPFTPQQLIDAVAMIF
jgi:CheY-like chemotaxis protein